jgi:hypothetical protein
VARNNNDNMMPINRYAPVIGRSEIEINADPETVWKVLADIENWPNWNPDVKSVSLEGDLVPGTKFKWKTEAGTITSTLQQVDPPETMAWNGKIMTIKAVHVYKLELKDGKILVSTAESWEGLLARTLRGNMQKSLQKSLDAGLQYLKVAVEK